MSVSGIRHYAYFEKNLYFEIRISHKDVVRAGRKECRVMYGQASDKRVRISHGITEKMRRRRARRRRRLLKRIGFVAANLFLVCLLFVVVRNGLAAKDLSQSAGVTKMQTKPQSFAAEPVESEPESEEALPSEPEEDGVYRIVLDPGHGGEDEGCSRDGVCESTINLAIALYTADFLREEIGRVKQRFPGLDCTVYAIHNDYFGENITVAGLVTATDLIRQLKGKDLGEELLIPGVMLRHEQDKFLDDGTIEDVQQALGVSVRTVDNDGTQFLLALLGIEDDAEYAW